MKNGSTLAFFMDKAVSKFKDYFDEAYLPQEIFSPEKIVDSEIYKKILNEDENVDIFGNYG
eukprot:CAMPEP_0168341418 /NCGR_PEP_ID=MMETSP0213-20121227/14675_1 /TAXON_ID=151035 /ORGANISM="Euplotes harpa, Strain FSP1.4" /LENGTH=60 /DNA_ID=CAMNT_0008347897 /DNA_START=1 /DNA_END=183 /DNA_ORIENTATION=-